MDRALLEMEEDLPKWEEVLSLVHTSTGRMKKNIEDRLNLHYQDGQEQDRQIFRCGPNHVCLGKICNIYQNNFEKKLKPKKAKELYISALLTKYARNI